MRRNLALIVMVFAVLAICTAGILIVQQRHQHAIQAVQLRRSISKLEQASRNLTSYDQQLAELSSREEHAYSVASAAGKRRHDKGVSDPANDGSYMMAQADIEKAAVVQMQGLIVATRTLHEEKYDLFSALFGDQDVARYRECDSELDEADTNAADAWDTAISAIDDSLRMESNGGTSPDDTDSISGSSYSESMREDARSERLLPKCSAIAEALEARLASDIAWKRRTLSSL